MKNIKILIFLILFFYVKIYSTTEIDIVPKFTQISKDLISGIFVGIKGESWVLPDTCLNQEFEKDISGFMSHLKKMQTVFCFSYLNKIVMEDYFANCPGDEIVNLYLDIKSSIKSGNIYLNSLLHLRKISILIIESIKSRKFNAYDIGLFFGKLINLTVYGKSSNNIINIFSNDNFEMTIEDKELADFTSEFIKNISYIISKSTKQQITIDNDIESSNTNSTFSKLFTKYEENKNRLWDWGILLDRLLEKYERNKTTNVLKKFIIFIISSYEIIKDFIQDLKIEKI